MTQEQIEKAIEYLKKSIDETNKCEYYSEYQREELTKEHEHFKAAISALEKQIPKPPRKVFTSRHERHEPPYVICMCGEELRYSALNNNYCGNCGQKLKEETKCSM